MKRLYHYRNGNYTVDIFEDGTKVRFTHEDEFDAAFPENIDIKITNWCDIGCAFCHENSTTKGKHGEIVNLAPFFNTLRPGTELAIGGGKVTSHPDLRKFLELLKERNIIPNITVQEREILDSHELIQQLIDEKLVYGVGISLSKFDPFVIEFAKKNKNCVFHLINGIHTPEQYDKIKDQDLKILILGYKTFRRGVSYFEHFSEAVKKNQKWVRENIQTILRQFKVVSFDNLAINQIDMKSELSTEVWDEFYMGDDGQHTMYIDLVEEKFAMSSTRDQRYDLLPTIDEMFQFVKKESKEKHNA